MMTSRHYSNERNFREETIKKIFGEEGKVVYSTIIYDEKRKRNYKYEVTENAVLIIKATDVDMIITKMLARPSRIRRVWANAPKYIIDIAIENARNPKRFK